jgi:hypothetical protein
LESKALPEAEEESCERVMLCISLFTHILLFLRPNILCHTSQSPPMKKFTTFSILFFFALALQGQHSSLATALEIKEKTEKYYKKIMGHLRQQATQKEGDRSLITRADTVVLSRNQMQEELYVYSYDLVFGRELPVGVTYLDFAEGTRIETLFTYNQNYQIIQAQVKLMAQGEEPVDIAIQLIYDSQGTLVEVEQRFELLGLPFLARDYLILARNEEDLPTYIRKESFVEFFQLQEIEPLIEIRDIEYAHGIPVSFVQTDFFTDEEELLDSISQRYRAVEWFEYTGQLLERAALDFSASDLLSESFIPQPDKSHREDLIQGEVDFWIEGQWEKIATYVLEERTSNTLILSRAGISLERFSYEFDENDHVTRKDYYYELDNGSLSERTDITYNEYQLPLSYRIYYLENDSLTLTENFDYRYDVDGWNRLTRITSDDFDRTIVDFIYVQTTSLEESKALEYRSLVYPNPARETIQLKHDRELRGETQYKMISTQGTLVKSLSVDHPHSSLEIERSGLMPGYYLLSIENASYLQVLKVILL